MQRETLERLLNHSGCLASRVRSVQRRSEFSTRLRTDDHGRDPLCTARRRFSRNAHPSHPCVSVRGTSSSSLRFQSNRWPESDRYSATFPPASIAQCCWMASSSSTRLMDTMGRCLRSAAPSRLHMGAHFGLFDALINPLVRDLRMLDAVRGIFDLLLAERREPDIGTRAFTEALMKQCMILLVRNELRTDVINSPLFVGVAGSPSGHRDYRGTSRPRGGTHRRGTGAARRDEAGRHLQPLFRLRSTRRQWISSRRPDYITLPSF